MKKFLKHLLCLFLLFPVLCEAGQQEIKTISPVESAALIEQHKSDPNFVLLDIRTPGEYKKGHIKGARLLDFRSISFNSKLDKLDKSKTYLIYCRTANRTGKALRLMETMGFSKVYNMSKGLVGWKAEKLPIVKE